MLTSNHVVSPLPVSADTHPTNLRRVLVAGDAMAALIAWVISFSSHNSSIARQVGAPTAANITLTLVLLAVAVAFTVTVLAVEQLYLSRITSMRTVEISRIGRSAMICAIAALIAGKFIGEAHLVRVPLLVGLCCFVFINFWRVIFAAWLRNARRDDRYTRALLLLGADEEALSLEQHFERHPELGYRIIGVVGPRRDYEQQSFSAQWLGDLPDLEGLLDSTGVNGAIVVGGSLGRTHLNAAIRQLLEHQVHVHMSTGIHGIDYRRIRSQSLAYQPLVYVERADLEGWQVVLKRVLDLLIAITVLIVTSPLMLIAAVVVKLDGGPTLFTQERVGRHGKRFKMIKFRSMVVGAEDQVQDLEALNSREGPLFKLEVDPRVTNWGRVMRATSIDELPQLINVLKGDMSLVGPRPALPSEVERFDEALIARHNVLPGITGLWQVEGRDNPDFAVYQRLDIFYVENWSVPLDISILLGTTRVVFSRSLAALARHRLRRRHRAQSPPKSPLLD